MKKIYSVALAASVALSAAAAAPQIRQANLMEVSKTNKTVKKVTAEVAEKSLPTADLNTMKKAKVGDKYTIDGAYEFLIGDFYLQDGQGEITTEATVTDNGNGTLTLDGEAFPMPVPAAYDAETGKLSFKNYEYGPVEMTSGATYYVVFETGTYDYSTKEIVPVDAIEATFDATAGTITFEGEDQNFGWNAYEDAACTKFVGYMNLFDVFEMQQINYVSYTGTFTDYLLAPLFSEATPSEVEVEVLDNGEGTYVVKGAFAELYAQWNDAGPNLVLDATDPENIMIEMFSTGINGGTDGLYYLLSASYYYGLDEEETPAAERIYKTQEGDNVTITFPEKSCLLYAQKSQNLYYACTAETQLKFNVATSGVNDINVENAPVKYYNLQGMEIAQPEAGQIVICRQGNKVTKKLVK